VCTGVYTILHSTAQLLQYTLQSHTVRDCSVLYSAVQGYSCQASPADMARYQHYVRNRLRPDDSLFCTVLY